MIAALHCSGARRKRRIFGNIKLWRGAAPIAGSRKPVGGETGIRTLGAREGTTVFETAPFDRSGTSPKAASDNTSARDNQ